MMYFYHPDHLGSSSYISFTDGEISEHIEYVPFGEVLLDETNRSYNTPWLFNGKELDEETGYYYYGARYYDPKVSQWLSVDPIALYDPINEVEHYLDGQHNGGYFNPRNTSVYGYCYQNPVLYVDPNGKQVDAINGGVASGNMVINDITNVTKRPKMSSINGIVLHRTVTSSANSAIRSTKNSKGRVGFHIVIDTDGATTQVNNFENRANHVGKPKGKSGISNFNSIGIEVVGMGYDKNGNNAYHNDFTNVVTNWDDLTPEQIESTAQVIYQIMEEYSLDFDEIFNHEDVSKKQNDEGGKVFDSIKSRLLEVMNCNTTSNKCINKIENPSEEDAN